MMKSFVDRKFFAFVVMFVFVLTVFPMVNNGVSMSISSNDVSIVFLDDSAVFSDDVKVVENDDGSVYVVRKGMVDGHSVSFVDIVNNGVGVCSDPPGTNLLPNPSFEEPGNICYGVQCPKHWDIYLEPRFWGNGTPLWDTDDAHSGSYSIGMKGFTDKGGCFWDLKNIVYVEPSEHFYNLAFWYKCKRNSDTINFAGSIFLVFFDECDNVIFSSTFAIHSSTPFDDQWHYTEVNLSRDEDIFPPQARYVRFKIIISYGTEWDYYPENEIRVDDVFFGPADTIVNNPPNDPVLNGMSDYITGVPYRLKVKVSDPDSGDKLFLRVKWGEHPNDPMDFEEYGPFDSGRTVSVFHTYDIAHPTYTINAQVFDDKGGVSDWVEKTIKLKKSRGFVFSFPGVFRFLKHFLPLIDFL